MACRGGAKWGKQEGGLLGVHTSCHRRPVPQSSVASDRGSGPPHTCAPGGVDGQQTGCKQCKQAIALSSTGTGTGTGTGTPHSRQVSTVTQSLAAACACMRKSDLVVDASSDAFAFLRLHLHFHPSSFPIKKPPASHKEEPLRRRSNEQKGPIVTSPTLIHTKSWSYADLVRNRECPTELRAPWAGAAMAT